MEGLLADPGDEVQLATTLGRLLGDANLRNRLGTAARARAERDFSAAVMTEAYERAYGIRT